MLKSLESLHFANSLPPVADYAASDAASDVHNLANFDKCVFVLYKGVGTTGTATITVEACDDVTPSNSTAVPFRYRNVTSTDDPGDITEVAAAGFAYTAGSNHLILVEADAVECAKLGFGYIRLVATEVVDDPVLAGILFIGVEARFSVASGDTTIV